jgi:tetratricopeptide (TPR) repeat protein
LSGKNSLCDDFAEWHLLYFAMMKKIMVCLLFASAAATAAADDLYSQAQKLYSQGKFEEAAKIYAEACPQIEGKDKKICLFAEAKALAETGKADLAAAAEPKLLSLISQTEPSDSLFAWLSMEDAKLHAMLGNPARAVRSWNAAQESASPDYFSELFVLCNDIISAYPGNGLSADNCNKVKPADTSLISLPRKKTVPLAAASQWYVQLGAFSSKENAERLVASFKGRNVQLYITELKDRKLFTVRSGYFPSSNDAKIYAEQAIAPIHIDYKIFKD